MSSGPEADLRSFKFERVLNQDTGRKSLNLLGTIDDKPAIVIAEKTAFNASNPAQFVSEESGLQSLHLLQKNDIYHWFMGTLSQEAETNAAVKVNMIYPCTDVHIRKYSVQKAHMVVETPEIYEKYVTKYVEEKCSGGRLNWVTNILEHKAESEKIIYEDTDKTNGFILLPDLKWDLVTPISMYLSVIVHRSDIRSIRDFNSSHIDFLANLRDKVLTTVPAKYPNITADQIKQYVHYQPSYYHFHVHVVHISHDMGVSGAAGKAILLDQIIETLKIMKLAGNASGSTIGFKDIDLSYALGEEHDLWKNVFSKLNAGEEPII